MNTGRPAVDEFFRELDAYLADGDPRLEPAQKETLKKLRPGFAEVAIADPSYFERELIDAARMLLRVGNG